MLMPAISPLIFPDAVRAGGASGAYIGGGASWSAADSKYLTVSFFIKKTSAGDQGYAIQAGALSIYFGTTGTASNWLFTARNDASSTILNSGSANSPIQDTDWHHFVASIDLTNSSSSKIYVDDVDVTPTWTTHTDDNINFSEMFDDSSESIFEAQGAAVNLAEMFIDNTWLDLTVTSNRRRFLNENGIPARSLPDGSHVTGSPPLIWMSGDAANFPINRGSGGDIFTVSGTLSNSSDLPVQI